MAILSTADTADVIVDIFSAEFHPIVITKRISCRPYEIKIQENHTN